jgi:hypothetical protein
MKIDEARTILARLVAAHAKLTVYERNGRGWKTCQCELAGVIRQLAGTIDRDCLRHGRRYKQMRGLAA